MAKRAKKKLAGGEPPMCNCLLLCDDVIVSHGRDKHVLQGVIGTIGLKGIPAVSGGHVVYLRLSNVYPNSKITVSFTNAETDQQLWEFKAEFVAGTQPLGVHTMIVRVPPFQVNKAGRHMLAVNHNGIPIVQTPITVHDVGSTDGADSP
jgi:hypothetical protein